MFAPIVIGAERGKDAGSAVPPGRGAIGPVSKVGGGFAGSVTTPSAETVVSQCCSLLPLANQSWPPCGTRTTRGERLVPRIDTARRTCDAVDGGVGVGRGVGAVVPRPSATIW